MSFRSTLKRRCFFCFTRSSAAGSAKEFGPEPEDDTEVSAEVVLSAGEADRGLVELESEFEREWVAEKKPYVE